MAARHELERPDAGEPSLWLVRRGPTRTGANLVNQNEPLESLTHKERTTRSLTHVDQMFCLLQWLLVQFEEAATALGPSRWLPRALARTNERIRETCKMEISGVPPEISLPDLKRLI